MSELDFWNNMVVQTAQLRHSVRWEGLRSLLAARDIAPCSCILIGCDQGDHVQVELVVAEGCIVANFREHPQTRQAVLFASWVVNPYSNAETDYCRQVLADPVRRQIFDEAVQTYFTEKIEANDRRLPPIPDDLMR